MSLLKKYYILLNHWFCIMRFLFLLWYCLVKHFNNIIQFLLKISLIWWDKFICNFKYIFINETGVIKNNCNNCGQIYGMGQGFTGSQGAGMGQENFSRHTRRGQNGVRQNQAGRGWKPHPSDPSRPIAISMSAFIS